MEIKKPDKKSLYFLAIALAVALLVSIGLLWCLYLVSKPGPIIDEEIFKELQRQKTIKKQLEELGALMGEVPPLTKKEIDGQVKNLDKSMSGKALTEEEIQTQLEQLDKLFKKIK